MREVLQNQEVAVEAQEVRMWETAIFRMHVVRPQIQTEGASDSTHAQQACGSVPFALIYSFVLIFKTQINDC